MDYTIIVQLHVFMFLTWRCCSLLCFSSRYSIRLHPNLIVEISGFICFLCLFTHAGVQHNFHIRCDLAVTRPVPLLELDLQELDLQTLPEYQNSPRYFVGFALLNFQTHMVIFRFTTLLSYCKLKYLPLISITIEHMTYTQGDIHIYNTTRLL